MTAPRVYKASGVWAGQGEKPVWVELHERDKGVDISTGLYTGQLSAPAARALADQLNELATRIEDHSK